MGAAATMRLFPSDEHQLESQSTLDWKRFAEVHVWCVLNSRGTGVGSFRRLRGRLDIFMYTT